MKTTDFIRESIGEDADEMHRDHEVQMARADCYNAAKYAIALHKILHRIAESQGLDGWVSEKITLANDYLRTVHEYLTHEMAEQEPELPAFTFESAEQQMSALLEGDVERTPTGLKHRAKDKYGAGEEPFNPRNPGKYARDLDHVNKQQVKDLDASMGITWKNRGTKGVEIDEEAIEEGAKSHSELARLAHEAYIAAVRSGNAPMANHYKQAYEKHKRLAASERKSAAKGMTEGSLHNPGKEDNPVVQAITRRIIMQRTDLLAKYGPEYVGQAIDDVADFVGDVDEIGSSDVSGWVRQVERNLKDNLNQYDEPMSDIDRLSESSDSPIKDKADYKAKRKALQDIQMDPNTHKDPKLKAELARRKAALEKEAKEKGLSESFGATSAGGMATVVGGKDNKPTTGVPKKVGNIMRRIAPKVGKGIY